MSSSPITAPGSAPYLSFFNMDDDFTLVSKLDPNAKEFVPAYYPIADDSDEARRVDDILRTMNHLIDVYDSEHEQLAERWANAEVPVDDDLAYYLDREDALRGGLHVPAQKPKGVTYGRKFARRRCKSRDVH